MKFFTALKAFFTRSKADPMKTTNKDIVKNTVLAQDITQAKGEAKKLRKILSQIVDLENLPAAATAARDVANNAARAANDAAAVVPANPAFIAAANAAARAAASAADDANTAAKDPQRTRKISVLSAEASKIQRNLTGIMARAAKRTPDAILANPRSSKLAKELATAQAKCATLPKHVPTNLNTLGSTQDNVDSLIRHLGEARHCINGMSEKEQKHTRKEPKKALEREEKAHKKEEKAHKKDEKRDEKRDEKALKREGKMQEKELKAQVKMQKAKSKSASQSPVMAVTGPACMPMPMMGPTCMPMMGPAMGGNFVAVPQQQVVGVAAPQQQPGFVVAYPQQGFRQ